MKSPPNTWPDVVLERYLAGDLELSVRREIEQALEAEPSLAARLERLRASREALLRQFPPPVFARGVALKVRKPEPRRWSGSRWWLGPSFAAAGGLSVALMMLLYPEHEVPDDAMTAPARDPRSAARESAKAVAPAEAAGRPAADSALGALPPPHDTTQARPRAPKTPPRAARSTTPPRRTPAPQPGSDHPVRSVSKDARRAPQSEALSSRAAPEEATARVRALRGPVPPSAAPRSLQESPVVAVSLTVMTAGGPLGEGGVTDARGAFIQLTTSESGHAVLFLVGPGSHQHWFSPPQGESVALGAGVHRWSLPATVGPGGRVRVQVVWRPESFQLDSRQLAAAKKKQSDARLLPMVGIQRTVTLRLVAAPPSDADAAAADPQLGGTPP